MLQNIKKALVILVIAFVVLSVNSKPSDSEDFFDDRGSSEQEKFAYDLFGGISYFY